MVPLLAAAVITASSMANTGSVSVTNNSSITTSGSYSSVDVENVSSTGGTMVHIEQNDNGKTNAYTIIAPPGGSVDFSTTTDNGETQVHLKASAGGTGSMPHTQASTTPRMTASTHQETALNAGTESSSTEASTSARATASFASNIGLTLANLFSRLFGFFGF